MSEKKGKLKAFGLFFAGLVIGLIIAGGYLGTAYYKIFQWQGRMNIVENVFTASAIRSGKTDWLINNIETNLPGHVLMIAEGSEGQYDQEQLDILVPVRNYYGKFGLEVPAKIKPIFDKLPPRVISTCEKNKKTVLDTNDNL